MNPKEPPAQLRTLRIVFASHTFCGGPFVVGSHQLAREISRIGHRIVHLSTPITPLHFVRISQWQIAGARSGVWWSGGKLRGGGFLEYVPMGLVPWVLAGPIFERTGLNLTTVTLPSIPRYLERIGFNDVDVLLIDQPAFVGLHLLFPARALILRGTDLAAAQGSAMHAAETAIARASDGLIGTSKAVLDDLRAAAPGKPAILVENGAETDHFMLPSAEPAELTAIPRPILIYVGALDERFDYQGISILARECPEFSIVLIGPKPSKVRFSTGSNIHLLGPRPYSQLAGYLQHADLGLLPLNDHPANAGRSPMKLYEYAAAGLRVVARRTAEIERRNDPFVICYDRRSEFADACRRALDLRIPRKVITDRALEQSWSIKSCRVLDFMAQILDAKSWSPAPNEEPSARSRRRARSTP
jgi:glycosyltransferase involved in cell wall biosynthesis